MGSSSFERRRKYVLGLDMGTSSLHCLLADPAGSSIAIASAPMSYFMPEGCPPLAREFHPDLVIDSLGELTTQLLKEGGISGTEVSAIGISSQRQGVVFLDHNGQEIYSGPNMDLRALFEGARIDEEMGKEIYAATGHFPSLLLAPARLRWFRENRAPIYESTRTILTIAGWLAYRLTGSLLCEPSLEAEAGLLDVKAGDRCPSLMDRLGVPLSLLPPLPQDGVAASNLKDSMATRWGLTAGTPVIVAGPDTQCGLLGMGLGQKGQAGAIMGWSGAVQVLTDRPCHDQEMRTWVGRHVLEGLWVAESSLGDTGNAYRWLKDTLLGSHVSFEVAERLAQEASAASEGVVAFIGPGPVSSLRAGLKLGGLLFPTPLTFQETSRGQLLRAALENVAYSVKSNLGIVMEVTGLHPQELYLGGGMANSRTLAAILASVLGFPVRRSRMPHVSARGAALAAAMSIDPSLTLTQAAKILANDCEQVDPGPAGEVAHYEESYRTWLRLYRCLEWDHGPAYSPPLSPVREA